MEKYYINRTERQPFVSLIVRSSQKPVSQDMVADELRSALLTNFDSCEEIRVNAFPGVSSAQLTFTTDLDDAALLAHLHGEGFRPFPEELES